MLAAGRGLYARCVQQEKAKLYAPACTRATLARRAKSAQGAEASRYSRGAREPQRSLRPAGSPQDVRRA